MKHDIFEERLCGIVEVDDAVVKSDGGREGWESESNVVGMASRSGEARMLVLNKLSDDEIQHVVDRNIGYVKQIYTDGGQAYQRMWELAPHSYVVYSIQWVDGDIHANFVENTWSLFKRRLIGMYHHVSTKYLREYLDESAFRYTDRHGKARLLDPVLASNLC